MHGKSKKILVGIGVFIIAIAGLYAAMLTRSATQLRRAYAALEADGRPLRAADVIPPPVPDEQNAALLYLRAVSMLRAEPAGEKDLLKHLVILSRALFLESDDPDKLARQKQEIAELKQWMGRDVVTSALSTVEQGTQRPACRFPREYGNGLPVKDPVSEGLRDLARVLGAKVCLEAQAGRPDKAWDAVRTQLQFADALRGDPLTSSQWPRMGMIRYTCSVMQRLCETAPPDKEDYEAIEDLLQDLDDIEPLVRALDGDRLFKGEWLFNLPEEKLFEALRRDPWGGQDAAPDFFYRLHFRLTTFRPRFIADHATYLQFMRRSTQLLQSPYAPPESVVHKEISSLQGRGRVTYRLAPTVHGLASIHCHFSADVRATRAMLALLQYRQTHGGFPPALEALGLKGLVDPYTQEPLHYRAEGEGFVVYSVGEDMKDNGGSPQQPRQKTDYDLVWRFPRPTEKED
jgi:hypothetical protein